MAEIHISDGLIEYITVPFTTGEIRIFTSETYATPDNQTVLGGKNRPSETRYQSIACAIGTDCSDGVQCVTYPAFDTDSTTDGFPNTATKSFVLYDNAGNAVTELYCNLYITPTPTTQTLAEIAAYNEAAQPVLPPSYYTAQQVDVLLAALTGAATNATTTTAGVVVLSQPAGQSPPAAVALSDKRWTALTESYYLEDAAGDLGALITTIGATQAEIVFTCPYTETIDRSIPTNIMVRVEGKGTITVANGKTLTINSLGAIGNRQVFFGTGTGKVILGRGATNEINATWWAPSSTTVDQTTAIQNIFASANNQGTTGGATVSFSAGTWLCSEVTLPNATRIKCAGHDPDAGSFTPFTYFGTVFKLADLTKHYVFKLPTGFRNITIQDCAISSGAATTASPLVNVITTTSDGFVAERVAFQSTYSRASVGAQAATYPLVLWSGSGGQQSTNNSFNNCWFQVPVNGTGFYCDTPNSSFTFDTCSPQCLAGATWLHPHNAGQILVNNVLGQGVDDFTNIAVTTNRSIVAASVTQISAQIVVDGVKPFSTITLKADTPTNNQFTVNDIFRRVDFAGAGFTGAYITQILSPFTAILSYFPASPIVEQPCVVKTFGDCPNAAYAMFLCDGNIVNMTVVNGIDEGFNYSFIGGCAEFATFKFSNYYGQGRVLFNETLAFNSDTCHWVANAFEDTLVSQSLDVTFTGQNVFNNLWLGGLLFAQTPGVWRVQRVTSNVSASYTPQLNAINPQYDMTVGTYNFVNPQVTSAQQQMFADYGVANSAPVLSLYTKATHGTITDQKTLLWIGKYDFLTSTAGHGYGHLRNEVSGRYEITGDQTGQGGLVGLNLNGDIFVSNFRGGCIYPTQIAADANNYAGGVGPNPAGLYDVQNIRVSAATDDLKISGIVLDYLDTDGVGYPDGTIIVVANVGTKRVAIPNEDTNSTAIARAKTCTGQTLYLMPGCEALFRYNKGTTNNILRWNTSLVGMPSSPVFEGAARFNTLSTITPGATPAIDASISNNGQLTPAQNETISISGALTGSIYWLVIHTSGTTSRKLTFGTGFTGVQPFNTGNVDAQTYDIFFKESGGTMIEICRTEPSTLVTLTAGTTVAVDASVGDRFVLTPAQNCTLNVTGMVTGKTYDLEIITSGTSTYNITFGTNFLSQGVLATGTVSGKVYEISFREFSGALVERGARGLAM